MKQRKLVALGANIFAGGFTLGVRRHFHVLGHLEHDTYGAEVSHRNLRLPIYVGTAEWPNKIGRLDWLYANPPCAIWSVASGRGGDNWKQDPRLQRIRDIFALVERYQPTVWTWESVCQAFSKGRPFVEELVRKAAKLGYSATYVLVDAAYLGTPQHRKRFFLVLHKVAIAWKAPDFTKVITVGQALRGVKPNQALLTQVGNHLEKNIIKHTKPGELLANVYDRLYPKPKIGSRGQRLGRPSFLKRRLESGQPSGVVIGTTLFHPTQDRYLAVNEAAALCGFPQSYQWPKSDGYNLLARGVMPPVGEWLARHVAAAVRRGTRLRMPGRWLVDYREAPGSVREVSGLGADVDLDWKPKKADRTTVGKKEQRREVEFQVPRGHSARTLLNGLGSGECVRYLLTHQPHLDRSAIVAWVHAHFPGRRTTGADVDCQVRYLREGRYPKPSPKLKLLLRGAI